MSESRKFGSIAGAVATAAALTACLWMPVDADAAGGGKETGIARMAGVWQLDNRASDDPRQVLGTAGRAEERRADQRREDEGRRGRGRRHRKDRRALIDDLRDRTEALLDGTQVLTIQVSGLDVSITDWHDETRSYRVDGRKAPWTLDDVAVQIKTSWRSSDRLAIETIGGPSGKLTEIFELGSRGVTLFVTAELETEGTKLPFVFERVYHRVESGAPH